jgi:hypothetical protein
MVSTADKRTAADKPKAGRKAKATNTSKAPVSGAPVPMTGTDHKGVVDENNELVDLAKKERWKCCPEFRQSDREAAGDMQQDAICLRDYLLLPNRLQHRTRRRTDKSSIRP